MRGFSWAPSLLVILVGVGAAAQVPPGRDIVADVRAAMASGGVAAGEKTLSTYRSAHPTTAETIEALSWLAGGALAAKQFDQAEKFAAESRDLAVAALKPPNPARNPRVQNALGTALETMAFVLVAQGARSDAVYFLRNELDAYRDSPIHEQIEANIKLVSLEGQTAPPLESGISLGTRLPAAKDLKGRPVLLFFWAHWCQECKADSPKIAKLVDKYRSRGLAVVAPTRRYGYVEAGRPATPDKELSYIARVRDTFYRFLEHEPVPVTDANHRQYGVSAVPMYVLIDAASIVRLYHPGRIGENELDAAIGNVLAQRAAASTEKIPRVP